ncbi:hypothetical protein FHX74_001054 [Friedmanniella endophytica]|uniref:Lipoprotein n=1 Tax=Microlunatus kandeliicorticis TaxID=1759536 RepID=A0A7W3IQP3_9ACTN|nr:hypothetical protein [Microlunatus kandeliicorticis]MBA8793449.1 hypothetical protein [Microlunatus kandeliicorticis]
MQHRPAQPPSARVLAAVALTVTAVAFTAGCGESGSAGAAEPAGAAPSTTSGTAPATTAPSRVATPSATPSAYAVPAVQPGELGRVVLTGARAKPAVTVSDTALAVGKVYRLTGACQSAPSGRVSVVLVDGADGTRTVNTFDVRCDGGQHPIDFQVAGAVHAGLRLTGAGPRTRAWATVVDAGHNGVCGC